jgi:hypothetical protein
MLFAGETSVVYTNIISFQILTQIKRALDKSFFVSSGTPTKSAISIIPSLNQIFTIFSALFQPLS